MHLVFDFDGTITLQDTIGELVGSAIALQRQRHGRHLQAVWEEAMRAYSADYEAYRTQSGRPAAAEAPTAGQEDEEEERERRFLAGLKEVEEASLDRVGRSGIFAGLDAERLSGMGAEAVAQGRVIVRDGLADMLGLASRRGWRTDVLSVNWSAAFIRGVLGAYPPTGGVTANEISAGDGLIGGPGGGLIARITTAPDKLAALRRLVRGDDTVVYFGDSTTDLECLLYDEGVAVVAAGARDDSRLVRTLRRLGHGVPHVAERQPGAAGISWASSFREVLDSGLLEREDDRGGAAAAR
ncbi:hypothetical protein CDD83_9650 [Cordyceps sp. RAO-2017]|nr:hypothetical protein CDD83_9650 [Cordyceps sp. RAO-2017]